MSHHGHGRFPFFLVLLLLRGGKHHGPPSKLTQLKLMALTTVLLIACAFVAIKPTAPFVSRWQNEEIQEQHTAARLCQDTLHVTIPWQQMQVLSFHTYRYNDEHVPGQVTFCQTKDDMLEKVWVHELPKQVKR